jgi:hypothetical protein
MSTYQQLIKKLQPMLGADIVELGIAATESGDLETATYICDYLATRKRQKNLNSLTRQMKKIGCEPIPFLSDARCITETFQKTTKGTNNLYIILLNDEKEGFGLYVGQTSRAVKDRFAQHLTGNRKDNYAARCHKQMLTLLPSLFNHLNPLSTIEAKAIEKSLIELFKSHGIRTKGA